MPLTALNRVGAEERSCPKRLLGPSTHIEATAVQVNTESARQAALLEEHLLTIQVDVVGSEPERDGELAQVLVIEIRRIGN